MFRLTFSYSAATGKPVRPHALPGNAGRHGGHLPHSVAALAPGNGALRWAFCTCAALLMLAPLKVHADETACPADNTLPLHPDLLQYAGDDDPQAGIVFEAGEVDASLGENRAASLSGGVSVRRGSRVVGAERAYYDPDAVALILEGSVLYRDPNSEISSTAAEFSYTTGSIRFAGAEFQLGQSNSRGSASAIDISQDGTLHLGDVSYTTCPPGSDDWLLQAGSIDLDTAEGIGTARDVKLRFQNVPILYTPFLSFPLGSARKTGLLTPELGSSGRSGNELSVPWYWNIAENYDATFTPRLLTDRGLQLGTEFRYLTVRNDGVAEIDYLADDSLFGSSRHLLAFQHRTLFDNGWRNRVDFRETSDDSYFEDLGGSLSASSITHLNRSVTFDYFGDHWSFLARLQDYQTIDDAIAITDEPYQRLPQMRARGYWPEQSFGLRYSFDSELVYFDREVGVTGWRIDAAPQVEWPLEHPGWFLTPAVAVQHTQYALNDIAGPGPDDPSRTLPISSLDAGLTLERSFRTAGNLIQTLEPRILYVHIPHREQADLPVFDTIVPDLNLVQLYRKNRFLGVDRIADTDQLSIGITSRILNVNTGRELVRATIGQALYLSAQGVRLPDQAISASESSDYIAEMRFLLHDNLNFEVGHQWGTGDNGTTQSEARLQYRPAADRILNLSYRFRRGSLEQGDLSWSWPLSENWNFVGRYNYSIRDDEALEQFYGLEYESCCWGLRLVSRRHLSTRDGTRDSSVGLQLVLKGMTNVGTAADKLLERGILGYSSDLD
ncbi:MAG: LPS assembly protein LptD [Woeseia sp.]